MQTETTTKIKPKEKGRKGQPLPTHSFIPARDLKTPFFEGICLRKHYWRVCKFQAISNQVCIALVFRKGGGRERRANE